MTKWRNRQTGSQIVQLAIVLPIILMLLYGSFEIWRVMQVKDALQEGVFQAVLYFSSYGYEEGTKSLRPEAWEVAQQIVVENVQGTGVMSADDLAQMELNIIYNPTQMECEDVFTVEVIIPFTLDFAPLARVMTLRDRQVGYYQCEPPVYALETLWPPNGYVGCPSEVRISPQCYTSPIKIQVRVTSNGNLHYESPWFNATCGNQFTHVFPRVPSGSWEILVCARGGRSELSICADPVRGSCP